MRDENQNYTGVVIKASNLDGTPAGAIVHYLVVGKPAGYATQGQLIVVYSQPPPTPEVAGTTTDTTTDTTTTDTTTDTSNTSAAENTTTTDTPPSETTDTTTPESQPAETTDTVVEIQPDLPAGEVGADSSGAEAPEPAPAEVPVAGEGSGAETGDSV